MEVVREAVKVSIKVESRKVHFRGQVVKVAQLYRKLEGDRGGPRQGESHPSNARATH